MKYLPIVAIILLAAWGTLGDSLLKLSAGSSKIAQAKFFIAGMAVYALSAFGWLYVMKHVPLSSLGFIYAISTSLLLVAIGGIYFKESLGIREVCGIVVSIISIVLLAKFN